MGQNLVTIVAQNVHRGYIAKNEPMNANFVTPPVDFKEMVTGSFHCKWDGNDAANGTIILQASNIPQEDWFDDMECAETILDDDDSAFGKKKTKLFRDTSIGYRYARIRYLAGSNTTGTMTIVVIGKKGG
jgi:hypothetical protein